MRFETFKLLNGSDMAAAVASLPIRVPRMAALVANAAFNGTPKGVVSYQDSEDGVTWLERAKSTLGGAAGSDMPDLAAVKAPFFRAVYTPTAQKQVNTFTLGGALVALNVVHCIVNGTEYTATYAASSDATLQALATAVAASPNVSSAVVTVVGGSQVGVDDRVLTITGIDNTVLTITGSVTAGAGQATVTIAKTQDPSAGSLWVNLAVRG